jgi:precorrin isomerase
MNHEQYIFPKLIHLVLDFTSDEDIQMLFDFFEQWKKRLINNQPIKIDIKKIMT